MDDYDLTSVELPVLKGRALSAFAAILDTRTGRKLLLGSLLESGGITRLRAMDVTEAPMFTPLVPADRGRAAGQPPEPALESLARPAPAGSPFHSIGDYAAAYARGTASPRAVAERILAALEADRAADPPIRAFIAVDRDDLVRQAEASSARHAAGAPIGPLDGVPVAVKDEVDMVPYPTTVGTRFLGSAPSQADATAVARLRAAGALLIGKANMHEIGINPTGHNVHHGHARNPYNPKHDTGGSSSGPAASVASGLCPVSLGADGGGSIRVPAAHCGLVGLKPTYGRVSQHGAAPLCWSLAHLGPISAHVADVALAYSTMAGPDPQDPNTHGQPPVSLARFGDSDLSGIRVGVYRPWNDHSQPEVSAACRNAVDLLVGRGATVVEITIPGLDALRIAHAVTILSEMVTAMADHEGGARLLSASTRVNLTLGRSFGAADYLKAQRLRRRGLETFTAAFDMVDLIVTPTTAVTAPRIPDDGVPNGISDLGTVTELMRYAIPGNLLGLPAVSVPAGADAAGLPIGVQLLGRHWEEALLLRAAAVIEAGFPRGVPERYTDLLG